MSPLLETAADEVTGERAGVLSLLHSFIPPLSLCTYYPLLLFLSYTHYCHTSFTALPIHYSVLFSCCYFQSRPACTPALLILGVELPRANANATTTTRSLRYAYTLSLGTAVLDTLAGWPPTSLAFLYYYYYYYSPPPLLSPYLGSGNTRRIRARA